MAAPRPSLPPRYAVEQLVAHGGMGDVYRASDERLGRVVAVKVLSERYARQEEFRQRFLREARTAATLTGEPNVVAIYDVGETSDGLPFIVMEYVSEGTVADRLASGPVSTETAMRWLAQAASALDAAHARGVVHRDVKPANLLVASDGAIRVSDFGIARAAGDDTLTAAGTVLGMRPGKRWNCLIDFFTDPMYRARSRNWEANAATVVAQFRAVCSASPDDEGFQAVLAEAKESSAEFTALWERRDIEDAGQKQLYRVRSLATVVLLVALVIVLIWATTSAFGALSEWWDGFVSNLRI